MSIRFNTETEKIAYRVQNTASTLADVSRGFVNLMAYAVESMPYEDKNQRQKPPLLFHRDCFQYYLTIQICKLFEVAKQKNQANSSLYKLNEVLFEKYSTAHSRYQHVKDELEGFIASDLYKHLRNLRDKTYAHSDHHSLNTPLKFFRLTEVQIREIGDVIVQLQRLFNDCVLLYGEEYTFHNLYLDSSPRNYLNNNFRSRSFFGKFGQLSKLNEVSSKLNIIKASIKGISEETSRTQAMVSLSIIESFIFQMLESASEEANRQQEIRSTNSGSPERINQNGLS